MEHDFKPHAGMHISDAARELCELATKLGRTATAAFNEIELSAAPGSTAGDVLAQYDAESKKRRDAYEAKRAAYLATPEGKEETRRAQERAAWVAAEVAKGILPFSVTAKADWEKCVEVNSDGYGSCTVRYAARWANYMEREIAKGRAVTDVAKETSSEADIEGITGFMYGCAVGILAKVWEHGEALRRWHNLDTQIGTEGEKANANGGVLNPAVLSLGGG